MEKEIVKKVCECAKIYDKKLKGKNLMFIFENQFDKTIDFIETEFLANNFKHLTGVNHKNKKSSIEFYKLCLNNKLSYKEIEQKKNGTTRLKLEILPLLLQIGNNAKIVSNYNNSKVNLYTEKIIGNVRCCIGFIKKDEYYVPNTIMKQDIRELSNKESISKILAILEKTSKERKYNKVSYIYKNINIYEIIKKLDMENKISLYE